MHVPTAGSPSTEESHRPLECFPGTCSCRVGCAASRLTAALTVEVTWHSKLTSLAQPLLHVPFVWPFVLLLLHSPDRLLFSCLH